MARGRCSCVRVGLSWSYSQYVSTIIKTKVSTTRHLASNLRHGGNKKILFYFRFKKKNTALGLKCLYKGRVMMLIKCILFISFRIVYFKTDIQQTLYYWKYCEHGFTL